MLQSEVVSESFVDISGQVAVITGGSRGLGFAAAQLLGQGGATVVVLGKSWETAQAAGQRLMAMGIDAVPLAVDVSDAAAVQKVLGDHELAAQAQILINSAGVMSARMSKTLRTTSDEWQRVMATNLDGVINVTSVIAPHMVERRSGRIINVSACLGRFSGPGLAGGLAPYRISKAAVNAFTKNLAAETGNGSRGVLVDAMCPNHSRTDMGGAEAPRSAEEGAETIVWLARRELHDEIQTGLLWEDRTVIPW
jgi:NAD(P)-dependent dehydrogenase (short-subunit alcohol dehydrogenase family)